MTTGTHHILRIRPTGVDERSRNQVCPLSMRPVDSIISIV